MYNKAVLVLLALFGYAASARLENLQYLPPSQRNNQIDHQAPSELPKYPGENKAPSFPQQPSGFQPSIAPSENNQLFDHSSTNQQPQQQQQPKSPLNDVPILRLDTENPGDGTYRYAYETGNDISAQEEGNAQSGWNKAQGSYRFVSPEGQNFEVTYTADENGYQPQGAHLPTPPPIPDAILKSLEIIRQAEASGQIMEGAYQPEGDDGQYRETHDEQGQYHHQHQQQQQQPQGFSHHHQAGTPQESFNTNNNINNGQQQQQQQPIAPNGGYRY